MPASAATFPPASYGDTSARSEAPGSAELHARFLHVFGITEAYEDPSNKLADVHPQLEWLSAIGFHNVDCYWKWMEWAPFGGTKPRLS